MTKANFRTIGHIGVDAGMIIVGDPYGDGLYPVSARFKDGRVMELRIRFD